MPNRCFKFLTLSTLMLAALALGGCESHIVPMRPLERVATWVPDEPAGTAPATQEAATQTAATSTATPLPAEAVAATVPATQPGHIVVTLRDPNQTARFIFLASYDNIWQQAMQTLHDAGFSLDRSDYRLGVLTTASLPSAQIVEFWKAEHVNPSGALENTINNQRRTIRLTISPVPGKPQFYQIAIQVVVERETNPTEAIGGPLFVEGSGFGRNAITLRSDYATPAIQPGRWFVVGHDPDLEKKLLDALFNRI